MKILLDGDGCVFDMMSAVHSLDSRFLPENVLDYDLSIPGYGITRQEFLDIANHPSVLVHQPLYDGAEQAVKGLLSLGTVVGWSAVSEANKPGRAIQFASLGVIHIDLEKRVHMDANVVIDDDVRQLLRFDDSVERFLIRRRYNETQNVPSNVIVVPDLESVVRYLREKRG